MPATTLTVAESVFNSITLKERIDYKIANELVRSNILDNKDSEELKKYLKLKSDEDGLIPIKYDKKQFGRAYTRGVSLQNLSKKIRHTITDNYYSDIDIRCSSQTVLLQIAKQLGCEHETLERYVNHRDEMLGEVTRIFGVDKDVSKELFIRVGFGGNPKQWCKDNGVESKKLPTFIYELQSEMKELAEAVEEQNPEIKKYLKKKRAANQYEKEYTMFTTLSVFYFEHENKMLESAYNYLTANNLIEDGIVTLCFDGLMIKKIEDHEVLDKVLNDLTVEVEKETGFKVEFTEKAMTKTVKAKLIKQQEELSEEIDEIDTNTPNFQIKTFNALRDYETQKKYFEQFFVHILDSDTHFRIGYKHLNGYWERELNAITTSAYKKKLKTIQVSKNGKETEVPFFDIYEKDDNVKLCSNIVFRPDGNAGDNFNLFTGFNYKDVLYNRKDNTTIEITEQDNKDFEDLMKFLHDYLCTNDDDMFDYLMQHLAQIIQKPCEKNDKIFVFFSEGQGRGKSSFLKFFTKVIGQQYGYFDKLTKIVAPHTTAHVGRLINVIEEMDFHESSKYKETLKDFCQRDLAIYNGKNIKEVMVETFVRYFITTNNTNGINIDDNDRRYVVIQILECIDKDLVIRMDRLLKSKTMLYLFGKYLEELPLKYISEIEWRNARPITGAYKQMITKSTIEDFVKEFYDCSDYFVDTSIEIEKDVGFVKVKASEFYSHYKNYCKLNSYHPKGLQNFYKEVISDKFKCQKKKSKFGGKSVNVLSFNCKGFNYKGHEETRCQITDYNY